MISDAVLPYLPFVIFVLIVISVVIIARFRVPIPGVAIAVTDRSGRIKRVVGSNKGTFVKPFIEKSASVLLDDREISVNVQSVTFDRKIVDLEAKVVCNLEVTEKMVVASMKDDFRALSTKLADVISSEISGFKHQELNNNPEDKLVKGVNSRLKDASFNVTSISLGSLT